MNHDNKDYPNEPARRFYCPNHRVHSPGWGAYKRHLYQVNSDLSEWQKPDTVYWPSFDQIPDDLKDKVYFSGSSSSRLWKLREPFDESPGWNKVLDLEMERRNLFGKRYPKLVGPNPTRFASIEEMEAELRPYAARCKKETEVWYEVDTVCYINDALTKFWDVLCLNHSIARRQRDQLKALREQPPVLLETTRQHVPGDVLPHVLAEQIASEARRQKADAILSANHGIPPEIMAARAKRAYQKKTPVVASIPIKKEKPDD
jgi:hypothetical protein